MIRIMTYTLAAVCMVALPALAQQGYDGLFAPAAPSAAKAPAKTTTAPGYTGVIAAPGAARPPEEKATVTQTEKFTTIPGSKSPHDLGILAAKDKAEQKMRTLTRDFSSVRHVPVDGRMPAENHVKRRVDATIAELKDKSLPKEERQLKTRAAYKKFSTMSKVLSNRQKIPDSVYRKLGVSSTFIAEEKAGNAAALARANSILDFLRPYNNR